MTRFLLPMMALAFLPGVVAAFEHPGGMHTAAQIAEAERRIESGDRSAVAAWTSLIAKADWGMGVAPGAVENLQAVSYYKNGKLSIAQRKPMMENADAAAACGLAYAIGARLSPAKREAYAQRAILFLNHWSSINKGVSTEGGEMAVVDSCQGLLIAAEMVWNHPGYALADKEQFRAWAKAVPRTVADLKTKRKSSNGPFGNNHNCWGILLGLMLDNLLEDQAQFTADIDSLKHIIDTQIGTDGMLLAEVNRAEAGMGYTGFALESMSAAVEVVRNMGGPDLFRWEPPSGGTLQHALSVFYHLLRHPNEWPRSPVSVPDAANPRGGGVFEAMGIVYGEAAWSDWASCDSTFMGEEGVAWIMPCLLVPAPAGKPPAPGPDAPGGPGPGPTSTPTPKIPAR